MLHGVGTDLCAINRISTMLEKHGDKFISRILTPAEIKGEVQGKNKAITPAFLARRFAAKEAIAKALGCGIGETLSFHDVTITRKGNTPPVATLSSAALNVFPNVNLQLSISDDGAYALAFAAASYTS